MSVGDPGPQQGEEEVECAICFDNVAESTVLPCRCSVPYCGRCWDRALAQSFKACGQARCPSCRGSVRVDFDADAANGRGRLVFSREIEDHTYSRELAAASAEVPASEEGLFAFATAAQQRARSVAEAREQAVARLAEQALPVQVRLLERFGASQPLVQAIAQDPQQALAKHSVSELKRRLQDMGGSAVGCTEKADLISQLQTSVGSSKALAARWAAALASAGEAPAPECVCGGALARVSGTERAEKFLKSIRPDLSEDSLAFNTILEDLTREGSCGVICDLCEDNVVRVDSGVWTCGRGDQTILHANAYDVCEDCFIRHALGVAEAPASGPHEPPTDL